MNKLIGKSLKKILIYISIGNISATERFAKDVII